MAGVFASLKEGVAGAVDGVGKGAGAVGGGLKSGLDASVEGTKAAASKVGDVSKGAVEATLKALSGAAQFQAVFSSTIDKTDEGLKKAFNGVDADSSGKISAKEMSEYIASVYGGPLDDSITKDMFKAADSDGDGEISFDEFKAIMRAGPDAKPSGGLLGGITGGLGGGADLIKGGIGGGLNLAKKGVDGAKGAATMAGDVSKGVLEATVKTLGGAAAFQSVFGANIDKSDAGLQKAFAGVDVDSSGKISAVEMNAHITKVYGSEMDASVVEEMFKVADTDGDGEVSLDEFKIIMRAGPDAKPKAGDTANGNGEAKEPFYKKCLP